MVLFLITIHLFKSKYHTFSFFFKRGIKLIQFERQQEILKILQTEKSSTVKNIAKKIYSSEATVRRDLKKLELCGYVKNVYGGVILSEYQNADPPLDLRSKKNSTEKDKIAKKAANLLYDGATIIMDSSTTVCKMCKYMKHYKNLKIITNGVEIFTELENCGFEIYCTGGKYKEVNKVFIGDKTIDFIRMINADFLFFSSQAISLDGDITDSSEEETAVRKCMLAQADKKIFLCDFTKIGEKKLFKLCHKKDIDLIICNEKLPLELLHK